MDKMGQMEEYYLWTPANECTFMTWLWNFHWIIIMPKVLLKKKLVEALLRLCLEMENSSKVCRDEG